jgi:hypothetical protein
VVEISYDEGGERSVHIHGMVDQGTTGGFERKEGKTIETQPIVDGSNQLKVAIACQLPKFPKDFDIKRITKPIFSQDDNRKIQLRGKSVNQIASNSGGGHQEGFYLIFLKEKGKPPKICPLLSP